MSVSTQIDGKIARVVIDNPPVNAAGHAVRLGLREAVAKIERSGAKLAILTCAGRTFVAGADIREFGKPAQAPHLPDVCDAIEASDVPWLAAIHGTALGGGLELCLACAYRVAHKDAKMGLPEVNLGIIPGAGGTVRLPRLIDPVEAMTLITSGKPINATKAHDIGLVDAAVDDLGAPLEAFAQSVIDYPAPAPLLHRNPPKPDAAFAAARARVIERAGGQNAIAAAARAVDTALTLDGREALALERESFTKLKSDPQSLALRHIFFAERAVSRQIPGIKDVTPAKLSTIGVIGGGTMGSGISAACLLAGLDVVMIEQDQDAADAGAARIASILDGAEKRGKLDKNERAQTQMRFATSTSYADLAQADLVIEAVFEDMDAKRAVFAELDQATRPDTILASNTSYLDINLLAAPTARPERVIGLHFFSPAHVMKLLEVITPKAASPTAIATGLTLAKRLGKIAVPAGVCDGFIGNRIMSAYRREADYMLEDGALPHEIDAAMREFGFPIGVFQMQDLAGLDIAWAMRKRQAATRDPNERYVRIADDLCAQGRFGRKAGRGWYDYSDDPKGRIDDSVTGIIEAASVKAGITRNSITKRQIMSRILRIMQDQGAAILREGIAASPEAIDVVMVNGYGFPRWRGGPMFMKENAHEWD